MVINQLLNGMILQVKTILCLVLDFQESCSFWHHVRLIPQNPPKNSSWRSQKNSTPPSSFKLPPLLPANKGSLAVAFGIVGNPSQKSSNEVIAMDQGPPEKYQASSPPKNTRNLSFFWSSSLNQDVSKSQKTKSKWGAGAYHPPRKNINHPPGRSLILWIFLSTRKNRGVSPPVFFIFKKKNGVELLITVASFTIV